MGMRIRFGLLVAVAAVAGVLAGGAAARLTLDPVGFASSAATAAIGGQATGGSGTASVDPDGSAKKGKGSCFGAADGDKVTCPSSHGKPAKRGKGYKIG